MHSHKAQQGLAWLSPCQRKPPLLAAAHCAPVALCCPDCQFPDSCKHGTVSRGLNKQGCMRAIIRSLQLNPLRRHLAACRAVPLLLAAAPNGAPSWCAAARKLPWIACSFPRRRAGPCTCHTLQPPGEPQWDAVGGGCSAGRCKDLPVKYVLSKLFANVQEMHVPLGLRRSMLRTVVTQTKCCCEAEALERRCSSGLTVEDV